jgi:hypothetical protein
MIRLFIRATLFACAVTFAPSFAQADQSAQLMVGDPSGANVAFTFDVRGSGEGLRIETHQVGNPGAKLSVWIDGSREKLFSRILTTDDCKFGDDGARCRLMFPRNSPDYRRFAFAFRRGRVAHVEVQNAAVMQMSQDISLSGFTRKLASGSQKY